MVPGADASRPYHAPHGESNMHLIRTAFVLSIGFGAAFASRAHAVPGSASIVRSSASESLKSLPSQTWIADDASALPTVSVYAGTQQQQIEGFGAAFTGASASVLNTLPPAKRVEILNKVFSPSQGAGFSLMRTHINSNDFSTGHYSYDDFVDDVALEHFSIAPDERDLIPLIRDAQNVQGAQFKIIASPWTAPAWMKTSGDLLGSAPLLPEYYSTWANYLLKYLDAYAERGIDVWAITAQNEPLHDKSQLPLSLQWEGMLYSVQDLTRFVRDDLGPTLELGGYAHVKILSGDDQKDQILSFADAAFRDGAAARYTSGIAAHWYTGDWFEQIDEARLRYPDKLVIATEAAIYPGAQLGSWPNAGKVAHDIIGDINNGAAGWIDWNLALNGAGGPNSDGISNPCSAPVIVANDAYTLNPQYYAIAHFSKYVRPGAFKVGNITTGDNLLEASAFANNDGMVIVVIYNAASATKQIKLRDGQQILKLTLPQGSITTVSYAQSNRIAYPASELISLRASNGKYVSNTSGGALNPNSTTIGDAQKFWLYYKADGFVTLKSAIAGGKYASVRDLGAVAATAETASTLLVSSIGGSWERFQLVTNADGTVSFKALKNGRDVQADLGSGPLKANGLSIGGWEKFSKVVHAAER
jgi:glucosylceramidase